MTAELFAQILLGAATDGLPYIGGGLAVGAIIFAVIWGIRNAIVFFQDLAEDRHWALEDASYAANLARQEANPRTPRHRE